MTLEVKAKILADESNFVKGTGKAVQSSTTLEKALGKLGPVGKGVQSVIDKLGLSGVAASVGLLSVPAAIGASAAEINHAIDGYVELGSKVRDYAVKTGQSAEASSRQVQAFAELGVGEDVAASGLVKLSKAIETTPKKLAALGIEIAKDSAGNVDLGQTLLNVATAWQSTTDAAKRNEIALAAFGKGGAAMIPILEADAAELANLEKKVQTVYTAEDLKKVRDYQIAQKELDRSWSDLGNTIGRDFLPAKKAVIDDANENIYVNEHLDEQLAKMGATHSQSRVAIIAASEALRAEYTASQDAAHAADKLTQSEQDAANAAQAEADAENQLFDAIHKSTDANFAYEQAQIDLKNAQDAVKKGTGDATELNLRLREAYVKVADAAVAQAEATAEASGSTLTAGQKADIYRSALQNLMGQLGPNDPLRKNLQGYIDELNSIPSSKNTTIGYSSPRTISATGTRGGTKSFDEGGIVPGATGAPMDATVHGGEMVLTPEQQAALGGGNQNATVERLLEAILQTLQSQSMGHGMSMDGLTMAMARRLGYATGR